jgi:hypothetical protein
MADRPANRGLNNGARYCAGTSVRSRQEPVPMIAVPSKLD